MQSPLIGNPGATRGGCIRRLIWSLSNFQASFGSNIHSFVNITAGGGDFCYALLNYNFKFFKICILETDVILSRTLSGCLLAAQFQPFAWNYLFEAVVYLN